MKYLNRLAARYSRLRRHDYLCLALLVLGSLVITSANAATIATCSVRNGTFTALNGWTVNNVPNPTNNALLASIDLQMDIDYTNLAAGSNNTETTLTVSPSADFTGYNSVTAALPLKSLPGVGAAVTFIAGMTPTMPSLWIWPWPSKTGTVFTPSSKGGYLSYAYPAGLSDGRYNTSMKAVFRYQLYVTDATAYGKDLSKINMSLEKGPQILWTAQLDGVVTNCFDGANTANRLTSIPAPVLPVPTVPTCDFNMTLMNQAVSLNPAISSSVAAAGAGRSAGAAGEKSFQLQASNCKNGALMNIYFTDTSNPASSNDYLVPTGGGSSAGKVGIRLYHDTSTTPIQFGPAPVGSTLPSRAPITYSSSGGSLTVPFTGQYVRIPGGTGSTAPAGAVSAATTVTIVYP